MWKHFTLRARVSRLRPSISRECVRSQVFVVWCWFVFLTLSILFLWSSFHLTPKKKVFRNEFTLTKKFSFIQLYLNKQTKQKWYSCQIKVQKDSWGCRNEKLFNTVSNIQEERFWNLSNIETLFLFLGKALIQMQGNAKTLKGEIVDTNYLVWSSSNIWV